MNKMRSGNIISMLLISLMLALFSGCGTDERKPVKSDSEMKELKEPLVQVNRYLVGQDYERIKKYAARRNWEFKNTDSGLWYQVLETATGDSIYEGDLLELSYTCSLLDGTLCYSSDSTGNKTFILGRGEVEPGLEEAMYLMQVGDSARIILPPHLAFGLLGDEKHIPARSILLYELSIISRQ